MASARRGNLPFRDLLKLARQDLDVYWQSALGSTPGASFVADAADEAMRQGRPPTRRRLFRRYRRLQRSNATAAYDKYGDNAAATLMAQAWADTATLNGRLPIARAPKQRAAECMAGAWAGNLVNGTRTTDATLSPGDLDEAVSTLLAFPGRSPAFRRRFRSVPRLPDRLRQRGHCMWPQDRELNCLVTCGFAVGDTGLEPMTSAV